MRISSMNVASKYNNEPLINRQHQADQHLRIELIPAENISIHSLPYRRIPGPFRTIQRTMKCLIST